MYRRISLVKRPKRVSLHENNLTQGDPRNTVDLNLGRALKSMKKNHKNPDRIVTVLTNTTEPKTVPPKFSKDQVKPYKVEELFKNVGKIEFAEPIMTFDEKPRDVPVHEHYWRMIVIDQVFEGDAEFKLNKYKKAEK